MYLLKKCFYRARSMSNVTLHAKMQAKPFAVSRTIGGGRTEFLLLFCGMCLSEYANRLYCDMRQPLYVRRDRNGQSGRIRGDRSEVVKDYRLCLLRMVPRAGGCEPRKKHDDLREQQQKHERRPSVDQAHARRQILGAEERRRHTERWQKRDNPAHDMHGAFAQKQQNRRRAAGAQKAQIDERPSRRPCLRNAAFLDDLICARAERIARLRIDLARPLLLFAARKQQHAANQRRQRRPNTIAFARKQMQIVSDLSATLSL